MLSSRIRGRTHSRHRVPRCSRDLAGDIIGVVERQERPPGWHRREVGVGERLAQLPAEFVRKYRSSSPQRTRTGPVNWPNRVAASRRTREWMPLAYLARSRRKAFAPPALPGLSATTRRSAPVARDGTPPLAVMAAWGSASRPRPTRPVTVMGRQVPTCRARAQTRLAPPTCRTPSGQSAGSPTLVPEPRSCPGFDATEKTYDASTAVRFRSPS